VGRSLLPWLREPALADNREYVVSVWNRLEPVSLPARMLRTNRYKYTYFKEDNAEELYDLVDDPGETNNLAWSPNAQRELERHRRLLREYCASSGDPFFTEPVETPHGFRSHAEGQCPNNREA